MHPQILKFRNGKDPRLANPDIRSVETVKKVVNGEKKRETRNFTPTRRNKKQIFFQQKRCPSRLYRCGGLRPEKTF